MNNATNRPLIPSLIEDVLNHPGQCVDNIFANIWKNLNITKLIEQSGFKKITGLPVTDAVFLLVLWKWIDVPSIFIFSKQSLQTFSDAKKDVMYDLLKREDVDWLGFKFMFERIRSLIHHGVFVDWQTQSNEPPTQGWVFQLK